MRRRAGASTGNLPRIPRVEVPEYLSSLSTSLVNLLVNLDKPLDNLLDKRHARFSVHLTRGFASLDKRRAAACVDSAPPVSREGDTHAHSWRKPRCRPSGKSRQMVVLKQSEMKRMGAGFGVFGGDFTRLLDKRPDLTGEAHYTSDWWGCRASQVTWQALLRPLGIPNCRDLCGASNGRR